jgi:hypothetical protein
MVVAPVDENDPGWLSYRRRSVAAEDGGSGLCRCRNDAERY